MKIQNRTAWRTDHLRAILLAVARRELDPEKRHRLRVEIVHSKGFGYSGWAFIKGSSCRLRVPNPKKLERIKKVALSKAPDQEDAIVKRYRLYLDPIDFAQLAAHEFAHLAGLRHRQMRTWRYDSRIPDWREHYSWAEAYPVEVKPKPEPPAPAEIADAKLLHARAMVTRWQSRFKSARTRLCGWERRVRYYEKRAAACAAERNK